MKRLLVLTLFLAACSRSYSTPVIGMSEDDFKSFCSPDGRFIAVTKSTITGSNTTHIYELRDSDFSERCDNTYTLVNGKLTEITR